MPTFYGKRNIPPEVEQQAGEAAMPMQMPTQMPQGVPHGMPQRFSGVPGVARSEMPDEQTAAMLLTRSAEQKMIGEEDIAYAAKTLAEYKNGKTHLEKRIVADELWWKLRHWEAIGKKGDDRPQPTSAWLFNAILNKHADAMDNYPEPVVLPREKSDSESAKVLSSVLPVVMEYNDFDQTYSDNWWEKLKHGTAAYGVFWNAQKENGLGDIDIQQIDLLKLFWEPGVTDIQKSRNLFIVDLVDEQVLDEQYPQQKGKLKGNTIDVAQYLYDDNVDTSGKSVVVDWYYKRRMPDGRTVVHYAKFVGNTLLYASENDKKYRERGFYDHGMYPVVLDCLFGEKGTPVGFGYVAICKDPQIYIDKISANILENSLMATKKRYFVSESTNVNEQEFTDLSKPIVHVAGELSDMRIKEIETRPLDSIYVTVMNNKIEEMKDTAANRDVNSGGTGGGVTAAAAIAALQEAGNKASRDMIAGSYRAFVNVAELVIELMRQFYDEARAFRIMAPNGTGDYAFVQLDNSRLRDQPIGEDAQTGEILYRKPVFDLKIKAQKRNPFSRMEENERAKELYVMGFFNPDRAQEAQIALDMMDFEGIEQVREKINQGQTLLSIAQQLKAENDQLKAMIAGVPVAPSASAPEAGGGSPTPEGAATAGAQTPLTDAVMQAQTPMTGYGQRLAERSKADMDTTGRVQP